jgi:hypothetical protein
MNKVKFELLPDGYEPSWIIKVDDDNVFLMDEFKGKFVPSSVISFLYDKYYEGDSVFNGKILIGTCTCRCGGCNDLDAKIITVEDTTTWEIYPARDINKKKIFVFDSNEYSNEIEQLEMKYYSYSWEDEKHKIIRLCNEYIRRFKTKEGKNIEEINIHSKLVNNNYTGKLSELGKIIELYYYDDWEPFREGYIRHYKDLRVGWDGKTIENALKSLKLYANKKLLKNNDEINLRPPYFRLTYTNDKNIIENK